MGFCLVMLWVVWRLAPFDMETAFWIHEGESEACR